MAVLFGCFLWPTLPNVRQYFGWKLLWAVILWATYFAVGTHSRLYHWAFGISVLWLSWPYAVLAWDYQGELRHWRRPWLLGAAVALFLASRPLLLGEPCKPMILIDGALGVFFAIPVCVGALTLDGKPAGIALVLAISWLFEALCQFGFSLHIAAGKWTELNNWLPIAVSCIGAIILAREATWSKEKVI